MVDHDTIEGSRAELDRRPQSSRRALVIGAIAGGFQLSTGRAVLGEEKRMTNDKSKHQIGSADEEAFRIYEQWHQGFKERDIDRVVALYAENAVIETRCV